MSNTATTINGVNTISVSSNNIQDTINDIINRGLENSNTTTSLTWTNTDITTPITTTDYYFDYTKGTVTIPYYPTQWEQVTNQKNTNTEKENEKKMNTEFNFGAYNNQNLRLSPYGMAIKNKEGKWVSYNRETNQLMDVDIINIGIDCSKVFFKVPKSVSSVNPGDIVLHNNTPVFVEEIKGNRFIVINPYEGTELTILPALSPFGYNYINVIVSLTEFFGPATEDNPFGNLLPLLLSGDNNNSLMLLLLMNGKNLEDIDPILLLACGNGNNNLLPFLLMQNNKPKYTNRNVEDLAKKLKVNRKNNSSKED